MEDQEQQNERANNTFPRKKYRKTMKIVMLLSFSALILSVILAGLSFVKLSPKYYASYITGQTKPLKAETSAIMTDALLRRWASTAIKSVYNINFNTYQQDLDKAKVFFTSKGWSSFNRALKSSGLIDEIIAKKEIYSAIVTGTPVILDQGKSFGTEYWIVQMPLMVTIQTTEQATKNIVVTTKIVRKSGTSDSPSGIFIASLSS